MVDKKNSGSNFRFETTLRPGEDSEETETRWYRLNEEKKAWEFYGTEGPSWEELSEDAQNRFVEAYRIILGDDLKKVLEEVGE